jgi:hypothetical protein
MWALVRGALPLLDSVFGGPGAGYFSILVPERNSIIQVRRADKWEDLRVRIINPTMAARP